MDYAHLDKLSLEQEILEAEADIDAGRFATHAEVCAWLERWGEPNGPGPAPRPWLDREQPARAVAPREDDDDR